MISVLTITLFCLPSDAAEKMTLCTSILVALVFFMLLISKILPSTSSSIPLISKYLMFTFLMNLLTVCFSSLSLYLNHHRTSSLTPMPPWMKKIFLTILPNYLFLNQPYEYPHKRQRRKTSFNSPVLSKKFKQHQQQTNLPRDWNYFIEQFLQSAKDIKYLSKKMQLDTEEMKVRFDFFCGISRLLKFNVFRFIMIGNTFLLLLIESYYFYFFSLPSLSHFQCFFEFQPSFSPFVMFNPTT